MERTFSVLQIKSASDSTREFEGIATTVSTDLVGDVVVPRGAVFKLPIPLLLEHDRSAPIGNVIAAEVSDAGITIRAKLAQVDEPGPLRDRLNTAWQSIRAQILRGLSIGFIPVASEALKTGGRKFTAWRWIELSACVVPANQDCSIVAVKAAFAASLPRRPDCVYLADGPRTPRRKPRGVVYLRGDRA